MSNTIGHNGTTGWVMSPRGEERAAKRTDRAAAIAEAWADASEVETGESFPAFVGMVARRTQVR